MGGRGATGRGASTDGERLLMMRAGAGSVGGATGASTDGASNDGASTDGASTDRALAGAGSAATAPDDGTSDTVGSTLATGAATGATSAAGATSATGAGATTAAVGSASGLGSTFSAAGASFFAAFFAGFAASPSASASPTVSVVPAAFLADFFTGLGSSGCSGRVRPSRSALRRKRSACASMSVLEWVFTPTPIWSQSVIISALVIPSSFASSCTLTLFAKPLSAFRRPVRAGGPGRGQFFHVGDHCRERRLQRPQFLGGDGPPPCTLERLAANGEVHARL